MPPRRSPHDRKPSSSRPGGPGRFQPGSPRGRGLLKPRGHQPAAGPETRQAGDSQEGEQSGQERLQKVLARAGLGSRRACEDLILQGRVAVNGVVVRTLGTRVDPFQAKVTVDGEPIARETAVYYAVHKPRGYVSTNSDPAGRPRVVDLLADAPERVYSVGRLDEDSTGLMILTNDGELANRLAHPRFGVEKIYRALIAGSPGDELTTKLTEGVWLSDGKVRAKRARIVGRQGEATMLELVLAEGKKREIRRMLAKLGHKVMSLCRIAVGPITLKGLPVGESRRLTRQEVDLLKRAAAGEDVRPPQGRRAEPRPPGPAAPKRPTPQDHVRPGPPRPRSGEQRSSQPPQADEPRLQQRGPHRPPQGDQPRLQQRGPRRPPGPGLDKQRPAGEDRYGPVHHESQGNRTPSRRTGKPHPPRPGTDRPRSSHAPRPGEHQRPSISPESKRPGRVIIGLEPEPRQRPRGRAGPDGRKRPPALKRKPPGIRPSRPDSPPPPDNQESDEH